MSKPDAKRRLELQGCWYCVGALIAAGSQQWAAAAVLYFAMLGVFFASGRMHLLRACDGCDRCDHMYREYWL